MNIPSRRVRLAAGALVTLALLGSAACGTTDTTDPSSTARTATTAPMLVGYDLPPGMIPTTPAPEGNPTQVHGVLGIPGSTWKGERPVAVIVHGTHDTCFEPADLPALAVTATWKPICHDKRYLRSDAGMSWLVEELAREGFVAVAIDVAGAEQGWNGEADTFKGYQTLIKTHLALLADFSQGALHGLDLPDLDGRIDTGTVALVGHSRGGGYVATRSAAEIPGIFATVSLEPQEEAEELLAAQTVPVLNLRGQCDEEVTDKAGVDSATWLVKQKTSPHVLDVLLQGTTHWGLNTGWTGFFENPCKPVDTAKPADSRAQVGPLVAAFLTQSLAKKSSYTLPDTGLLDSAQDLATGDAVGIENAEPPAAYADPTTIDEVSSTEALLPPLPKNFSYDEEAAEDY